MRLADSNFLAGNISQFFDVINIFPGFAKSGEFSCMFRESNLGRKGPTFSLTKWTTIDPSLFVGQNQIQINTKG